MIKMEWIVTKVHIKRWLKSYPEESSKSRYLQDIKEKKVGLVTREELE